MPRRLLAIVVAVVAPLAACSERPTEPAPRIGPALGASAVHAVDAPRVSTAASTAALVRQLAVLGRYLAMEITAVTRLQERCPRRRHRVLPLSTFLLPA